MKFQKAFLLTILYYLFLELIGCWILLIPYEMDSVGLIKANHLINALVTLILLLVIFKSLKHAESLEFKKTEPKYYLIALLLGIGFVFFQSILNIVYYQEIVFNFGFTLERLTSLSVLASIIIVPITEELVFRNYVLRGLLKKYNPLVAIIFSSLLFALIHIPLVSLFFETIDMDFHQAYIAVFGGLIAGTLFYKTKSIIPSIIFHICWNLASYVL